MPKDPPDARVRVTLTELHSGDEKLSKDVSNVLILYLDSNKDSQLFTTMTDKANILYLLEKTKLSLLLS